MTSDGRSRPAVVAGLLLVWAVSWSAPLGRVSWDTKYDLLLDPAGLLQRAAHLWDPQVTWGGLANQGYGYLFPMGPFFATLSEVAPMWVVQRSWWMVLLTLGFWGTLGLLGELEVGTDSARVVGALAWVLAPKVVSSVAVLSAEVQPQILAPLVMWPVVLGWRGRLRAWEAAVLSGGAILLCGGVNGSASLLALAPTALFLMTRATWWRAGLTWAWASAAIAATVWWFAPLVLMGRYAPPFLDWIETAQVVGQPLTLLEVVRGTTHWLGHLLTPGGPWWPAGFELATRPALIIATTVVSALGVAGLAMRSLPLRAYCWISLAIGLILLSMIHSGPFESPIVDQARAGLDGPLAPLRNIHKADALVRLPLTIGLTHAVSVVASRRRARQPGEPALLARVATGAAALLVVAAAAPAFTGAVVARGAHQAVPGHWHDVGRWLDAHGDDGSALVIPAANFGEYTWGRTIDEPLRSLTAASYAVRDAVPLAPAGTIRLLDDVERRTQSGRSVGGLADVLRRSGVRHLVLRNDLSAAESGQPPVALTRSAVRDSPGITFVRGFGTTIQDPTGERVFPVEVYRLDGRVAEPVTVWRLSQLIGASGASEDLSRLADAGLGDHAVIFDVDRTAGATPGMSVTTDGLRLRNRFFGAPRGQDLTQTLDARRAQSSRDYLPPGADAGRSEVRYEGVARIRASSSLADTLTFAGLQPSARAFAALDGQGETAWLTMWDPEPTLAVELTASLALDQVTVTPAAERHSPEDDVGRPTSVLVLTDTERVEAVLDEGPTVIRLGGGETSRVEVQVLDTTSGAPDATVTGLAELSIPGVEAREVIHAPRRPTGDRASTILLGSGLRGRDGCVTDRNGLSCLGGQFTEPEALGPVTHVVPDVTSARWTISGVLDPLSTGSTELAEITGVRMSASSSRTPARLAQADAVIDGDSRTAWSPGFSDRTPSLRFTFPGDVTVSDLRVQTRGSVGERVAPVLRLSIGGQEFTRRLGASGAVSIPGTSGPVLEIEMVPVPGEDTPPLAALEIEEVLIDGLDVTPPPETVEAPCGFGPDVVVDGTRIATRATATREGWLGLAPVSWQGCDAVITDGSPTTTLTVNPWNGFGPRQTRLERTDAETLTAAPGTAQWSEDENGRTLTVEVGDDDQARVLVMTQNANEGWRAELAGSELAPQVVDGRRQGFVLPPGVSGTVVIDFAPDRLYQVVLTLGLLVGGAVAGSAAWALALARRRRAGTGAPIAPSVGCPTWVRVSAWLVVATVVAGAAGLLTAVAGTFLGTRLATRARAVWAAGLTTAGGVAQAAISPGAPGPAWLEGSIRLGLILALTLALSALAATHSRRES